MILVENLLFELSLFMKLHTFIKKNTSFYKKTQFCIFIKNSNLYMSFYKKLHFWRDPCRKDPCRNVLTFCLDNRSSLEFNFSGYQIECIGQGLRIAMVYFLKPPSILVLLSLKYAGRWLMDILLYKTRVFAAYGLLTHLHMEPELNKVLESEWRLKCFWGPLAFCIYTLYYTMYIYRQKCFGRKSCQSVTESPTKSALHVYMSRIG